MRRLFSVIAVMAMLSIAGCGDSSVSVVIPIVPIIQPPSITSYQFTKNTATEFVNGTVDFYAPDTDIDTITITVFDSRGFEIARKRTIVNLAGVVRGTIPFSIDYLTFPIDTYTFSIYLTDFNGNISNQVVDTFRVP
jgi:hypothetical protein